MNNLCMSVSLHTDAVWWAFVESHYVRTRTIDKVNNVNLFISEGITTMAQHRQQKRYSIISLRIASICYYCRHIGRACKSTFNATLAGSELLYYFNLLMEDCLTCLTWKRSIILYTLTHECWVMMGALEGIYCNTRLSLHQTAGC